MNEKIPLEMSTESIIFWSNINRDTFYVNASVWCRIWIMAKPTKPKIRLFRSVRRYFKAMGYYAPTHPKRNLQINRRNGLFIIVVIGMIPLVFGFFAFKAETPYEYSHTFYISITACTVVVNFVSLYYKLGSIPMLMRKYQGFIAKRKWGFFTLCDNFCGF